MCINAIKCFDNIWHEGLFYKLMPRMITIYWRILFNWYKSMRTTTRLNNEFSQIWNITKGTRQGIVLYHYNDVIMGAIASQITSFGIVYSIVYSDADQRKHQSSASLAFVRGINRGPVNSPHKWPVTRKMFPFDDVIMMWLITKSTPVMRIIPCFITCWGLEINK